MCVRGKCWGAIRTIEGNRSIPKWVTSFQLDVPQPAESASRYPKDKAENKTGGRDKGREGRAKEQTTFSVDRRA